MTAIANGESGLSVRTKLNNVLAQTFNVKDVAFAGGAKGDGITDDAPAINAAVTACVAAGGGTVYFPGGFSGFYIINSSIKLNTTGNLCIKFKGDSGPGTSPSTIQGNFNGYLFDQAGPPPTGDMQVSQFERLRLKNTNATHSGIMNIYGGIMGSVRDCRIETNGAGVACNQQGDGTTTWTGAGLHFDCCHLTGNGITGSIGIMSQQVVIKSCRFTGWDQAIRAVNVTLLVTGCSFEVNNVGLMLGRDINNAGSQLQGCTIQSSSFESNVVGIYVYYAAALNIIGNYIIGFPGGGNFQGLSPTAAIEIDFTLQGAIIANNAVNGSWTTGGIYMHTGSGTSPHLDDVTFANMRVANGGGPAWVFPSENASGDWSMFRCIQCNVNDEFPFSFLPTNAAKRNVGQEYNISDCVNSAGGTTLASPPTFGQVITFGGGPYHAKVRWNGSAWTVMGV